MYDAFVTKTNIDLKTQLGCNGKLASPITDIVDAWSLATYGYDIIRQQKNTV